MGVQKHLSRYIECDYVLWGGIVCGELGLLTEKWSMKWPHFSNEDSTAKVIFLLIPGNILKIRNQLCIFKKPGHFIPVGWFLRLMTLRNQIQIYIWHKNSPCLILIGKIEYVENNCKSNIHLYLYVDTYDLLSYIRYCSLVGQWYAVFWKVYL